MNKPYRLLKKIGDILSHIKIKNIQSYKRFNLYCQDESRIGLLTMNHKALTIRGVKPLCRYQHKFDNVYLFGAFSPIDGSHLLYLLKEHGGIDAKIIMPEDWRDPLPDT